MTSPGACQVVNDLRTLRTLADYLLRFDAVTLVQYLDSLRTTEGPGSLWLFHDAAHTIFEQAKRRVYVFQQDGAVPGARKRKGHNPAPSALATGLASGKAAAPHDNQPVLMTKTRPQLPTFVEVPLQVTSGI